MAVSVHFIHYRHPSTVITWNTFYAEYGNDDNNTIARTANNHRWSIWLDSKQYIGLMFFRLKFATNFEMQTMIWNEMHANRMQPAGDVCVVIFDQKITNSVYSVAITTHPMMYSMPPSLNEMHRQSV